jgi:hypothetical protein
MEDPTGDAVPILTRISSCQQSHPVRQRTYFPPKGREKHLPTGSGAANYFQTKSMTTAE